MGSNSLGHLGSNQCGFFTLPSLAWFGPLSLSNAIMFFTDRAKTWNKDHFGNIFHRKRRVSATLRGVQSALGNNLNKFLIDLEKSFLAELSTIANLEVEF